MNQEHIDSPVYSEVQRFRQGWVGVLITIVAVLVWATAVEQFLLDSPLGQKVMPDIMLVIFWLLFGVGFPAIFVFGGLHTRVHGDGIYVRFTPFHFSPRKFAFSDITRCEVRTYKAIREYGGWGIKCGKSGRSYTVSGNMGVQLEFSSGKPLLIGSQRAEELCGHIQAKLR